MRYPLIFLILALLMLAIPTQRHKAPGNHHPALIQYVLSEKEQQVTRAWLDGAVGELRALPPLHQVLTMTTITILLMSAATILSYLINSVASIAGIGVSLTLLLPLLLLACVSLFIGWRKPRAALHQRMKKHAEFGPFVSRLSTRAWKRRFAVAAREHGFNREY